MSFKPIKFGTDGWRATIAEDYTFDNVRICAQGVATFLVDSGLSSRGLIVGYDTRFASEFFAIATAEVVAANGIKVYLCEKTAPTPVVSYAILDRKAAGAVMITASHNPWTDNGFKYKPDYAGSASPEVIIELEKRIHAIQAGEMGLKRMTLADALSAGLVDYFDPAPPYLAQVRRLVDVEAIKNAGLRVAVDSMYGAGIGYFKKLIAGGKTEITEIHTERNPFFGGIAPEPITRNLGDLLALIKGGEFDVGLTTDGDSDRIGAVDERGQFVTQLQVFALLGLYLLEVRGERGPIIKSITTTSMAYRLGEIFNVPVYETPVGFKYIGPKMMETNALLGGEESGGFGFRGHIPERDGIVAGLYLLDMMIKMGKKPTQMIEYLYSLVGPHVYDRIDLHFPADQKEAIIRRLQEANPKEIDGSAVASSDNLDGFRYVLADGSWLLIRFSGTEPVMRVYTETTSQERIERILADGRRLAGL
ncbi:MAG: phosphoglucomutase/phosphomannomutase family protein [Dehalococcoidia bacterium]|nr:phosphoglucomutase/phosphomannomutase family protein [Dehalococcoidia bacterium]